MTTARPSPLVFVVGCPRSGTTLLQRMLDHHPSLAVANDTHFIPRCVRKIAPECLVERNRRADPKMSDELLEAVLDYHRFPRLGLDAGDVRDAANGADRYSIFVGRLYDRFASSRQKRHGGEKTPDYVRCLPWLSACFPESRIVHIVRDGRDVALSLLDWAGPDKGPGRLEAWSSRPLATAATWWRWQVMAGLDAGRSLAPGRVLLVRYEDLVAEPIRELDRVCNYLKIPMSDAMLSYHVGRERSDRNGSAKSNWLPPTAGLRDWRRQMEPEDVALFEVLTADALEACGMPRSGHRATAATRRLADEHLRWWREHLAGRHRRLLRRIERRRARRQIS